MLVAATISCLDLPNDRTNGHCLRLRGGQGRKTISCKSFFPQGLLTASDPGGEQCCKLGTTPLIVVIVCNRTLANRESVRFAPSWRLDLREEPLNHVFGN